jgi:hypothetical protein
VSRSRESFQRRAVVSDFAWQSASPISDPDTPKYHYPNGQGNPYAQLDPNAPVIPENPYSTQAFRMPIYCSVTRAAPIRVATVRKSMGNMTMNHMAFLL